MPSVFNILVMLFILAPLIVVVGASFNEGEFTTFPPTGFSFEWYARVLQDPGFVQSFFLSVRVAVQAAVLAMIIGMFASLAINRLKGKLAGVLQFLALGPLILPEVLMGLGLVNLLIGQLGIRLNEFTLVLAHVLVTLPFVVNITNSTLSQQDSSLEAAARNLGASPFRAFWTVTFPAIKTSVIAGGIFAFIFSFDNIGMSLFLSVPGLVPLPIRMYQYVTYRYDPTIAAASTILIVISLALFLVARRLVNIEEVFGGRRSSQS
jgi:putative spermidine/putrescine transport system permease protein